MAGLNTRAKAVIFSLLNQSWWALKAYRLSRTLYLRGYRAASELIWLLARWITSVDIYPSADIGGHFVMPHAHGIVIGQHVRIGNNVTALQGTTVGTDLIREEYAPSTMPQIGNRVFLGAGSKVLGAVRIGDDAVIGANAVVISDVPAGALAVGVPAVIKFNRNQKGKERA